MFGVLVSGRPTRGPAASPLAPPPSRALADRVRYQPLLSAGVSLAVQRSVRAGGRVQGADVEATGDLGRRLGGVVQLGGVLTAERSRRAEPMPLALALALYVHLVGVWHQLVRTPQRLERSRARVVRSVDLLIAARLA